MSSFIGQDNLFKTINSYSLANFPHTIALIGEEGCGKHTVAKYIANKFGLKIIDFQAEVDKKYKPGKQPSRPEIIEDLLLEYSRAVIKTCYILDISKLGDDIRAQSQFLKFLEEPNENNYIVLINNSKIATINTILNRCIKLRFEPYTIDQLKQIKLFTNDIAYKVCRTPGQLNNLNEDKLNELYTLCTKIIDILPKAEYANLISVATKINYNEDYNKFDFNTFFSMMEHISWNRYIKEYDKLAYCVYLYIIKRVQELTQSTRIQKEPFMINFLDGLWKEVR